MSEKSLGVRLLPLLALALMVLLVLAAVVAVFPGVGGSRPVPAAFAALSQRVALLAGDAVNGRPQALDELARTAARLNASTRNLVRAGVLTSDQAGAAGDLGDGAAKLLGMRESLESLSGAATDVGARVPELLAAMQSLQGGMSAQELQADRLQVQRFQLLLGQVAQALPAMVSGGGSPQALAAQISDADQTLGNILAGLAGEDSGLEIRPLESSDAAAGLARAQALYAEISTDLQTAATLADTLGDARAVATDLGEASGALLATLPAQGGAPMSWPLLALLGGAIVVLLVIVAVYYRARDFRRSAEVHAEQNERNQRAILRLLDQLSNLADGDLTVEATVTEDITGAIADSINYAIEALRELVMTVNESAILVDSAAKQTESNAGQLATAMDTQSRQVNSASDAINHVVASIEEVSGNAERASDVARHSVDVAHKGGDAVRRTIEGMNTIRETIQDTSKRIKRLGESSQEIGNIVELINDIAEQTNILALNASIQASMAGEAGRGFAVVADEVQRLAERSANATKQIEVLVRTIQSDTNEAVVSMERSTTDVVGGALLAENAGAALDEIEQVSNQIASLVQNISGSARQQSESTTGLTRNMSVLRQVSAQAAEITAATTNAIRKLSELASQLRQSVAGFTLPDKAGNAGVLERHRPEPAEEEASDDEMLMEEVFSAAAEDLRETPLKQKSG